MTFSLGSTPRSLVKYNDKSIAAITDIATSAKDAMVLIKTLTASSSATLDFIDGTDDVVLDSTYPIYKFMFINIHPGTDNTSFNFQFNAAGASGFNETITSTTFRTEHDEGDTETELAYSAGSDQGQGTAVQKIGDSGIGADNDQCVSGELHLFEPSSTTFVKHFIGRFSSAAQGDAINDLYVAGYVNATAAVDEVQFAMSSGNIDAGTIKLYGIKDS